MKNSRVSKSLFVLSVIGLCSFIFIAILLNDRTATEITPDNMDEGFKEVIAFDSDPILEEYSENYHC